MKEKFIPVNKILISSDNEGNIIFIEIDKLENDMFIYRKITEKERG